MDPERWHQIDRMLDAALALREEERAAFLKVACGGDDALRDEVESLLAHADAASRFLETPAAQAATATSASSSDLTDEGPTRTVPATRNKHSRTVSSAAASLVPGQTFGPYRIVRLLGRGGMGDVYEAEQIEHGRRVALKVLRQQLTDPHARARFLREGQLAASITHPYIVYIFGSEEVAGTPVIAMELLAGGTLKDRVLEEGPLPPAEAVDAILQVIAGLDAALAGGILHRDIKPANCFIGRDGAVKVGDFGLSISTRGQDLTQLTRSGAFQGTPEFAAPEQLKGEPLDVRADMYAVGATLYYLLTGQPPFDDTDLMALLTRVATEVPRSPRALQSRVPRGLAAIVLRCLGKERTARPATYAALDEALRPFGSPVATPATMGLRFLAGAIDWTILSLPFVPLNIALMRGWSWAGFPWWLALIETAMMIAYYGILEGLRGDSLGKRLVGLRVTRGDGQPLGIARAFWRAVVFETPIVVATLLSLFLDEARVFELVVASQRLGPAASVVIPVLIGLLFSTARRRNGFAAVHDLASRTRIVWRSERGGRSALDTPRAPAPAASARADRYGPYEVVRALGSTDCGELWLGFDPSLRRHIWIHTLPPGAAAVPPRIRDLSRPARLRWLSGRRSGNETWDAYEALDGVPLSTLLDAPRSWGTVRTWLLDLAREIDAGLQDASITALTIDRVWITHDGDAKLLDFRAPYGPHADTTLEAPVTQRSGQTFLAFLARRALDGPSGDEAGTPAAPSREPPPLSASTLLEALSRSAFPTWSDVVTRTAALAQDSDCVGHKRRAAPLALCGVMPTMTALVVLLVLVTTPITSRARTPEVMVLNNALILLSSLSQNARVDGTRERAALEVYIASRFRAMITDPQTWTTSSTARILARRRVLAERVVANHPNISADDMATATAAIGPLLREVQPQPRDVDAAADLWKVALQVFAVILTFIAVFGIVWAFVLRGGLLLQACHIAVVTGDGKPASRLRALWRGLLAWALVPAAFWLGLHVGVGVGVGVGVVFLAGAAWALAHPTRGLQDRIAGTWLVPR